jgi:carbamoyl-phosphate synthase small subunit
MQGTLHLKDGSKYDGESFGALKAMAGEVVFTTGMVGYPEAITDPSFKGQILVMTYPLIGNYGVPEKKFWESGKVQISGLIVCNYIDTPSHHQNEKTLSKWLIEQGLPALVIKDTRGITQKLRTHGVMLGKIDFTDYGSNTDIQMGTKQQSSVYRYKSVIRKEKEFEDPNLRNLVAEVSTKKMYSVGKGKKTIVLIDCGAKLNIARAMARRGVEVLVVPWDTDVLKIKRKIHGVLISNGPGDPAQAKATIENVKKIMAKKIPIFGICLGNQILALAAGGTTYKLKFGHRGQNQPAVISGTKKAYLTTQNHGFAVGKIPKGFKEWFYNANDKTNEGITHKTLPFMSVQFHPESTPGPLDTGWLFDEFLKKVK